MSLHPKTSTLPSLLSSSPRASLVSDRSDSDDREADDEPQFCTDTHLSPTDAEAVWSTFRSAWKTGAPKPKPHQITAVHWALQHGESGLIADQMGLGKTLIMLMLAWRRAPPGSPQRVLIVADKPHSIGNFVRQIKLFLNVPASWFHTHHGADRGRRLVKALASASPPNVVITCLSTLMSDADLGHVYFNRSTKRLCQGPVVPDTGVNLRLAAARQRAQAVGPCGSVVQFKAPTSGDGPLVPFWDAVMLDEAHAVAVQTQGLGDLLKVKKVSFRAVYLLMGANLPLHRPLAAGGDPAMQRPKLMLFTGTPVRNRETSLLSLFALLSDATLLLRRETGRPTADPDASTAFAHLARFGFGPRNQQETNLRRCLAILLAKRCLRRTARTVGIQRTLQLPRHVHRNVYLTLSPRESTTVALWENNLLDAVEGYLQHKVAYSNVLVQMGVLRQALISPELMRDATQTSPASFFGNRPVSEVDFPAGTRLQAVVDLAHELCGVRKERLVVVVENVITVELVRVLLTRAGLRCGVIEGRTSVPTRAAVLADLHADRVQVLVATRQVISHGINVYAQNLVVTAPWFSPSTLSQLRGRIVRQDTPWAEVRTYDLIVRGTMEEWIASHVVGAKMDMITSILGAGAYDCDQTAMSRGEQSTLLRDQKRESLRHFNTFLLAAYGARQADPVFPFNATALLQAPAEAPVAPPAPFKGPSATSHAASEVRGVAEAQTPLRDADRSPLLLAGRRCAPPDCGRDAARAGRGGQPGSVDRCKPAASSPESCLPCAAPRGCWAGSNCSRGTSPRACSVSPARVPAQAHAPLVFPSQAVYVCAAVRHAAMRRVVAEFPE